MLGIDAGVSDAWQHFGSEQGQTGENYQQRQHVHPRQPVPPRREGDPDAADDDHRLDAEESEQPRSALVLVRPERQRGAEGEDEDESRASADHRPPLLRALLGAPLILALQLLECRRRLGRQPIELAFDLF